MIIEIVAVLIPAADGLNVTINVVLDEFPTELEGNVVTLKSLAFAPKKEMAPIFKIPSPVLFIVKVRVELVVLKSVQLVVEGVELPLIIAIALPVTFIDE